MRSRCNGCWNCCSRRAYDVASAATQEEGFAIVQNGGVDLFLLSADLSDLQCCNALAEVKGLATTASTRVILLTHGEGVERARGLDLGADDVLSAQWDAAELLARVRVQLRREARLRRIARKARLAEEGQEIAQTAFQALAVTEKMTRDAITLNRALKIGVGSLIPSLSLSRAFFCCTRGARTRRRNARIRSSRSLNTASTGKRNSYRKPERCARICRKRTPCCKRTCSRSRPRSCGRRFRTGMAETSPV